MVLAKVMLPLPPAFQPLKCAECQSGVGLGFDFTIAFQPIIHLPTQTIFAQEALVRGVNQESASTIFAYITDENRYRFDQTCRVKAIHMAVHLEISNYISINFLPNAVYRPELCIRATLEAAELYGFPPDRIIFEFSEGEPMRDVDHITNIIRHYQKIGFLTAIDDFGAGYAGLNLLADLQTDLIKIDMALIRSIDQERKRQAIVHAIVQVCQKLKIVVIAEGIETHSELQILRDMGVEYFQGYYFARPAFESLATIDWHP